MNLKINSSIISTEEYSLTNEGFLLTVAFLQIREELGGENDFTIDHQKLKSMCRIKTNSTLKNNLDNLKDNGIIEKSPDTLSRNGMLHIKITDAFSLELENSDYEIDILKFQEVLSLTDPKGVRMYSYIDFVSKKQEISNKTYLSHRTMSKKIGVNKNLITKYANKLKELKIVDIEKIKRDNSSEELIPLIPTNAILTQSRSEKIIEMQNKLNEKHLEEMIIKEIHLVEEGMTYVANQLEVKDGIIDILARDKTGRLCIIEVKVVDDCKDLIFQSAYYPTQILGDPRMITITPAYRDKIKLALESLKYVEMKTYRIENGKLNIADFK
ncbi:endonuclease NucS domain-containing protein [Priestia sp. SB1]|uniref:endonuclease NucS domain-containing protein n=1 Tax=Priestia sp. SB1 TaxID=3132359 RepID=UPI00317E8CDD